MTVLFSEEVINFINENYRGRKWKELTDMINLEFSTSYTEYQIRAYGIRHHLSNGRKKKSVGNMPGKRLMTPEEEKIFAENNFGKTSKEMQKFCQEVLGKTFTIMQIKGIRGRMHLDSGLTGYFEKGHVPMNKGKKVSPEIYARMQPTMFKKGQSPLTKAEIGTVRRTRDRWEKKVTDLKGKYNWVPISHIVLKEQGIEVKPGELVRHLDGNTDNLSPDNLMVVTKAENAIINHEFAGIKDQELARVVVNVARLKHKAYHKKDDE